jgi:MFS superfamily sulfate permease-like transporter
MYKQHQRQFLPFMVTVIAIFFTNLLVGITIGLIVSIYYILQDNRNHEPFEVYVKRLKEGKYKYEIKIELYEEIYYLSKNILLTSLQDIPENSMLIIDGSESRFISEDVMEVIEEFKRDIAPNKNIEVQILKRELKLHNVNEDLLQSTHA